MYKWDFVKLLWILLACTMLIVLPAQAATAVWDMYPELNWAMCTGDDVCLRSGPGTEYRVLGHAYDTEPLEVLINGVGWAYVRVHWIDAYGWISTDYITRVN